MLINSLPLVVKCGRMKKNIAHGTSSSSRHTKWPSVYQNVAHHIVPMKRRLSTTTAATQAIFDEFSFPFSHPHSLSLWGFYAHPSKKASQKLITFFFFTPTHSLFFLIWLHKLLIEFFSYAFARTFIGQWWKFERMQNFNLKIN